MRAPHGVRVKARFSLISDAYANNNTSGINKWLATNGTIAVVMLGDVLMECPATASHLSRLVAANGTAEIRTQMRIGKPYQTASERSGCDIGKPRRLGIPWTGKPIGRPPSLETGS